MTKRGEIVWRKYHVKVKGFPTAEVVCLNAQTAKMHIFRSLQEAGYYRGSSFVDRKQARNRFFNDVKVKALGVCSETAFRSTILEKEPKDV